MREILTRILIVAGIVCLAAVSAAILPVAITAWQSRADLRGAVTGFRLMADRGAALIGDTEPDEQGEPFTVARLVATADGTVLLVRPVLTESAETVRAARKPILEAAETVKAARPVLTAAKDALEAVPPGIVEIRGKLVPVLENAAALEATANDSVKKVTPFVLGAVAAGKVTAGNTAQITRDVKPVVPKVAQNVEAISADTRKIIHRAASPWSMVTSAVKKFIDLIF
jgi:hypothetical protein